MWMFEGVFGERFSAVDLVLLCVGGLQVSDMQLAGSSFLFFFLPLPFFSCAVVYISRNPNLCLVARQESSNRDMFSMLKKKRRPKLLSLFQYPRVCFFFWIISYLSCMGCCFFSSPHLVLVCTYLKRRATPFARQADAGAVTTQTQQESHSHHLDMRAMLAILAPQPTRRCGGWTFFYPRAGRGVTVGAATGAKG